MTQTDDIFDFLSGIDFDNLATDIQSNEVRFVVTTIEVSIEKIEKKKKKSKCTLLKDYFTNVRTIRDGFTCYSADRFESAKNEEELQTTSIEYHAQNIFEAGKKERHLRLAKQISL